MSDITTTISTNNNLDYLKLAVKSVRQNALLQRSTYNSSCRKLYRRN